MMRIGFIGLGIMGKPMALNLVKAGYSLTVYTHKKSTLEEFEKISVPTVGSAKEVAMNSDVVFLMVQDAPQVQEAICGAEGVLEGIHPGMILVDCSSIDPTVSVSMAQVIESAGGEMIDAPVSGGEPKAIDGSLSFMCGGKPEVFEKVKPILMNMGKSVVLCGGVGAGNTTKLCNQMIVAANIAAVSEALVFGQKANVDPEVIFQAIRGGLAGSTVMEAKVPMMLAGDEKPGFRIDLHVKDMRNAMNAARVVNAQTPISTQVYQMLLDVQKNGHGSLDHSALLKYYIDSISK